MVENGWKSLKLQHYDLKLEARSMIFELLASIGLNAYVGFPALFEKSASFDQRVIFGQKLVGLQSDQIKDFL